MFIYHGLRQNSRASFEALISSSSPVSRRFFNSPVFGLPLASRPTLNRYISSSLGPLKTCWVLSYGKKQVSQIKSLTKSTRYITTEATQATQATTSAVDKKVFTLKYRHIFAIAAISFGIGSAYVMSTMSFLPSVSDAETLKAFKPIDDHQAEIEEYINAHPLVKSLRSRPEFTESRPHLKYGPDQRESSLTAGTLAGPGRIVVPPYVWAEDGGRSLISISYLGPDLCGHPGIVHGGLLATLLDEGLARCCFPALPNRIGVTASLTVNYRKPCMAGQYVVLRARTVKVEGRKAWVEGHIETLPKNGEAPAILVEASALMVEPKQAAMLRAAMPVDV